MDSICANVQHATPRNRFVRPYVEAPRQVIGFDLSPKGTTSGATPNSDGSDIFKGDLIAALHSNCTNSCSISSKTANTTTATSPRSALQQLLFPSLPQSEPASVFSTIGLTHGPLLAPTCKSHAATTCSRGGLPTLTREQCTAVDTKFDPAQAAPSNWPICKGIAELVTPSQRANDGKNPISSAGSVSAVKYVAGDGKQSNHARETSIYELPWRSQRDGKENTWNFKDQVQAELPSCKDKSKKSIWMKGVTIEFEKPKSNSVDISWKQANVNIPEKSTKKSSLFMLVASSPTAELYSKHHHLHGMDQYGSHNNIDMDFLNSCFLCKRLLGQGHDVFMYSGDKAFCSLECRYQQIVIDERMGRRAPPVIRSGASPVYQGYMASAGSAVVTAAATATTHYPITANRPNFMKPAAAA